MMRLEEELTQRAKSRNVDRYISQNPKGGIMSEGFGKMPPPVWGLPQYGQGGYGKHFNIMADEPAVSGQMLSYGKRFPSFQDYEKSPLGAARLDDGPDSTRVYDHIDNFLHKNRDRATQLVGTDPSFVGTADPSNSVSAKALIALAKDKSEPERAMQAQELIKQLRRTQSDYGELKVYGPVGFNRDSFAGLIADPNLDPATLKLLEQEAKRKGLKFGVSDTQRSPAFDMAQEMQRR
jgi:hypothetical protein